MFDYANHKTDPINIALYVTLAPFALLWAFHNTWWTGFLLQAYLVTFLVFVSLPYDTEGQNVQKPWFWKAMLRGGIAIHPLFLLGLFAVDSQYHFFVTGTGTVFFTAILVGPAEAIILRQYVKRYIPPGTESESASPSSN